MEFMVNGKEIEKPDGKNQVCFESTNDNKRYTDMIYLSRSGNSKVFLEDILIPGEIAEIVDEHTLAFCFAKGDVKRINLDESVNEETAKELIEKIKWFIENSYEVKRERLGHGK